MTGRRALVLGAVAVLVALAVLLVASAPGEVRCRQLPAGTMCATDR